MKIGLMVPNYARWFRDDAIWDVCLKAKELGVDALSFVDHIIITRNQYAGMGNGYMEQYMAMSYVAAITNAQGWKPILTQTINVIPYRPPVLQAKMAATLDSLSGGRLLIGGGAGYIEQEFDALGLDVTKRGEMTREYVQCMRELWKNQVASFHGKYANFDEMTISVRPSSQPYPPVLYGSHGPGPRRDIANLYQGSIGSFGTMSEEANRAYEADMKDLDDRWRAAGRQGKPFHMAMDRAHLTTSKEEAGETVTKGVVPRGQAHWLIAPGTRTIGGGQTHSPDWFEIIGAVQIAVFLQSSVLTTVTVVVPAVVTTLAGIVGAVVHAGVVPCGQMAGGGGSVSLIEQFDPTGTLLMV